mgnify:CR=1 FL=1
MSTEIHISERNLTNKENNIIKKIFTLTVQSFTGTEGRRCFLKSGHKHRSKRLNLYRKLSKLLDIITQHYAMM